MMQYNKPNTIVLVIIIVALVGGYIYWKYGDEFVFPWLSEDDPIVSGSATATPSVSPTATPSVSPSATPSVSPSATPSVSPSATPSVLPTAPPSPTASPSTSPITTQRPATPQPVVTLPHVGSPPSGIVPASKKFGESCVHDSECMSTEANPLSCTEDEAAGSMVCKKTVFKNGVVKRQVCYEAACNQWMLDEAIFANGTADQAWHTRNMKKEDACGNCGDLGIDSVGTLKKNGRMNTGFRTRNIYDYKGKYDWLCFKNDGDKCSPDSSVL